MKKNGDIALSRTGVLGPYDMVSIQNCARGTGYAEDGFDPQRDLDMDSLRFGSDSVVNQGVD